MFRVGQGYDVHQMVAGRPLILGGVRIPHDKGLLGHSDADALLHAITDALLGAAALGDIGRHFPDTDPNSKARTAARCCAKRPSACAPRLASGERGQHADRAAAQAGSVHRRDARGHRRRLGLEIGAVNVKGKTNEKLGYLGRCEAIEAQAACLLMPCKTAPRFAVRD
ncbi:2-C-methyl-D-erythritol 2,4-cyclodiphosphate synthase [Chromobacterium sp. Beijing]|uniref:2-C-methyl-D-erythritol 2,4-cyclodiphosphate synthase n=1 Tax=Chromobacterium sp. Beijing TaxID=2735795 RepID=UPI001F1EA748|nr:2-C-methyl-D-erythritol 2,4-cyclodiphosphate synthase [Chromobacterium sp. Beijing]